MTEELSLTHERIDDIPLLIGLAQKLRLAEVLDRHIGNHGHHRGLSNGTLAMVWLAYILSEQNHKKSLVQEWADDHHHMLEQLLGQPIRDVEFSDDRLGIVLRRLSDSENWHATQADLWHNRVEVYAIEIKSVRLDATAASGYHEATEDGIMQKGHTKDYRPDLAQVKLMAACVEPSGQFMASDAMAGQSADTPLYLPMIVRLREMLAQRGLLYTGDSKMAAIAIRADIAAHEDYYLMPLPTVGETAQQRESWIAAAVDGTEPAQLIWRKKKLPDIGSELLGAGYEFSRPQTCRLDDQEIQWTERVQVVRSFAFAKSQIEHLEERLTKAQQAIVALTPAPGRGKRQYDDETKLQTAVAEILARHKATGLLFVAWQRQETTTTHYTGRGRGGADRPMQTTTKVRYQITTITRDEAAITQRKQYLGWRVMATNVPLDHMSLTDTTLHYRQGVCIESDFHNLKDRPIGISPLYVRRDDQIVGLTNLLCLALFLLTLIQTEVHRQLAERGEQITGLYAGQPKRATTTPTTVALLKAIAKQQPTLTRVQIGSQCLWHITPLSDLLRRVLDLLGLSHTLYLGLVQNSP